VAEDLRAVDGASRGRRPAARGAIVEQFVGGGRWSHTETAVSRPVTSSRRRGTRRQRRRHVVRVLVLDDDIEQRQAGPADHILERDERLDQRGERGRGGGAADGAKRERHRGAPGRSRAPIIASICAHLR